MSEPPPQAPPRRKRRVQIPPNCDLTLGVRCVDKTTPGRTVWTMAAQEKFANPAGVVQGGFLAAMADTAMSAAAVTFLEGRKATVANVEMKVSFTAPARVGTMITATAWVVRGGRRVSFLETELHDESGVLVLKASSTFIYTELAAG